MSQSEYDWSDSRLVKSCGNDAALNMASLTGENMGGVCAFNIDQYSIRDASPSRASRDSVRKYLDN